MSLKDYLTDIRILAFIAIVVALAIFDAVYGIHFGMEFVGGTQIPITLQHPVDSSNMSALIGILQQRVSSFGLSQVTVQGVGDQEVVVQLSNVSNSSIQNTVKVIENQGVFQGVVNGKEAINGSGVEDSSVSPAPVQVNTTTAKWQVDFYITQQAAVRFSKVVFGQANQPIYLFLDRPSNSIMLLNSSLLQSSSLGLGGATTIAKVNAINKAAAFANSTIPVEIYNKNLSNWNTIYQFLSANRGKYSTVILARNTPNSIIQNLTTLNYTLSYKSTSNMTPVFQVVANGLSTQTILNTWPAMGLLDAPTLSPSLTNGNVAQSYLISGVAPSNMTLYQQQNYSTQQGKQIASILRGGALPVHVIVGTPTTIPPELGKNSEVISLIAALLAVIAVTVVIAVRYRRRFLIGPIMLTTLGELFIIGSIVGLVGTIDLAAVAGMIAVVGTGVDAQIIISDELLVQHTEASTIKSKLGKAFYVVWADAALLIVAMLPLLFSTSLVTVIGFSESTIIGAMLGALITRPAYGAILSRHYSKQ